VDVRDKMAEVVDPATQKIAAVLADVDGTLVTKDKVLTPRAIKAVQELQALGVLFAITSGRPPRGMRMLVEPLGMKIPMAAFNGGMVVMPDMTVVDERTIPPEVAPAVIEMMRAHGLYVWIYRSTEWYVTDAHGQRVDREASTVQFEPTVVPTFDGLHDRVVKIVGNSPDHDLVARAEAAVQEQFGEQVSAARSQPYYLDVTHPTANKGVVVERLSNYFKIPLAQIATLGDQPNDVLMFKKSGLSIAMANASEEVQNQATYVTDSHNDEGFAKGIEGFILPRAIAAPPSPHGG
jgi:Cof subfamily protein (haloacid dehalogenase superfamily)